MAGACKHSLPFHSPKSKLIIIIISRISLLSFCSRTNCSLCWPDMCTVQRQDIVCAIEQLLPTRRSPSNEQFIFLLFFRAHSTASSAQQNKSSYFACFNPITLLSEANKIHNGDQHRAHTHSLTHSHGVCIVEQRMQRVNRAATKRMERKEKLKL